MGAGHRHALQGEAGMSSCMVTQQSSKHPCPRQVLSSPLLPRVLGLPHMVHKGRGFEMRQLGQVSAGNTGQSGKGGLSLVTQCGKRGVRNH